jgi:hypothetical protein
MLLTSGVALALLAGETALSQQMQPAGDAAMHKGQQPYSIETFGMFRNVILTGDFTAKVQLGTAMAKHPTTGVGAERPAYRSRMEQSSKTMSLSAPTEFTQCFDNAYLRLLLRSFRDRSRIEVSFRPNSSPIGRPIAG